MAVKNTKGKKTEEERGEYELYIRGIAWSAGEKELQDLFSPFGEITAVRLLRKEDGKSRGIGFVTFALNSARTASLEINGTEQFGREISVEEAKGKQTADGDGNARFTKPAQSFDKPIPDNIETSTIFVGNLAYRTDADSLRNFFQECGTVVDSRVVTDKETGRVKLHLFR